MLKKSIIIITLAAACFTVAGFFGLRWRYFELSSHFRLQYAALLSVCGLVLLHARAWKWLLVAVTFLAANIAVIIPFLSAHTDDMSKVENLRIVSSNVRFSNTRYAEFISFVRKSNPDVVFVQEATPLWLQNLHALDEPYPYMRYQPNRHGFGLALYSRLPFRKIESEYIEVAYILGRVRVNERPVWLLDTHLFTPTNEWHFENRNQELNSLAGIIEKLRGPIVVAGDFNMSIWSPYYDRFISETKIVDVRDNRGIFPTYPAANPVFRIPIDLCFVSQRMKVVHVQTGPNIGSDHLPLIVDLEIPPT